MDLKSRGCCKDCRYWVQKFPQNKMLGVCPLLGIMLIPRPDENPSAAITYSKVGNDLGLNAPITDVYEVRTTNYFGCISFYPKSE